MTVKKTPSRKRSPKTPAGSEAQKPGKSGADEAGKSAAAKNRARSPETTAPASAPSHQDVADLAYQKFEAHGRQHGRDLDDWVEAERELQGTRAGSRKRSTPKR